MTAELPKIEVVLDYDGYFEAIVRRWVNEKAQSGKPFKHRVILVSAGPYRAYAVAYEDKGESISLDFYSPLRTGFGELGAEDVAAIKELL
jgi:hypothetical protein